MIFVYLNDDVYEAFCANWQDALCEMPPCSKMSDIFLVEPFLKIDVMFCFIGSFDAQ